MTLLRLPRATWDTLYAEDGQVFLQMWLDRPSALVPFAPYDGYLHLWPRLVTAAVSAFPISDWPFALLVGAGMTTGAVGTLAALAARNVIRSPAILAAVALVPSLLPFAGVEALDNMANIHWYFMYLGLWILCHPPESRSNSLFWSAMMLVACLTEVQLILLGPLVLWRAWSGWRAWRLVAVGWALGCLAQATAYILSGSTRAQHGLGDPMAMARGFLVNVVLGTPLGNQSRVNRIIDIGGWALPVGLLAVFLSLLVLGARRPGPHRTVIIGAFSLAAASWAFSFLLNNYEGLDYVSAPFALIRWGTGASLLVWAAGLAALDTLPKSKSRTRGASALMTAGLLVLTSAVSPAEVRQRHGAPSWADQIAVASAYCAEGPREAGHRVSLSHAPSGWSITVPCARTMPQGSR